MAYDWIVFESFNDTSYTDRWPTPAGASLIAGPHDYSSGLTGTGDFNLPFQGSSGTVGTIGARVKRNSGSGLATLFDGMFGTNVNHARLTIDETNVYLLEGGTSNVVTSAPHGISVTGWFYIEWTFNINVAGSTVVYINGEEIIADSFAYWNASSTSARINIPLANGWAVSDLYCHNSRDTADLLGPIYVVSLAPTADGDLTDFTGSYTDIDEQPPSTADSITSTTSAQRSTFEFQDLPTEVDTVHAVRFDVVSEGDGAWKTLVRSVGDTNANGGTHFHPTAWAATSHLLETNPVTASAWTASDVNDSQFGVESA